MNRANVVLAAIVTMLCTGLVWGSGSTKPVVPAVFTTANPHYGVQAAWLLTMEPRPKVRVLVYQKVFTPQTDPVTGIVFNHGTQVPRVPKSGMLTIDGKTVTLHETAPGELEGEFPVDGLTRDPTVNVEFTVRDPAGALLLFHQVWLSGS